MKSRIRWKIKVIPLSDEKTLRKIAALVTEYSWLPDYPVDPLDELKKAEYIIGAYADDRLAGFGTVNRYSSPDGRDNGEIWFGDAVVMPEFRNRGIYRNLYENRMDYVKDKPGKILSCTDSPLMEKFFLRHGWREIRKTRDEGNYICSVFEYDRKK